MAKKFGVSLSPSQKKVALGIEALTSPKKRGMGRTTLLALSALARAKDSPGESILLLDHHIFETGEAGRSPALISTLRYLLHSYPSQPSHYRIVSMPNGKNYLRYEP